MGDSISSGWSSWSSSGSCRSSTSGERRFPFLRAAAGKPQTASAEFRGPLGIQQTASVESLGRTRARGRCVSTRRKWVVAAFAEGIPRIGPTLLDQFTHAGPPCGRRGSQPSHDEEIRNTVADFRLPSISETASRNSASLPAWNGSPSYTARQANPPRLAPLFGKLRCRGADRPLTGSRYIPVTRPLTPTGPRDH